MLGEAGRSAFIFARIAAASPPQLTARLRATFPGSNLGHSHIALSPDGKLLATRYRGSKKIKLFDAETREVGRPNLVDDRAHAVVGARPATLSEPNRAHG